MKNIKLLFASSLLLLGPITGCSDISKTRQNMSGNDAKVVSVSLDITYMELETGMTLQLTPTITYKDDAEVEVYKEWITSNSKVAAVNENGLVTALGGGRCAITFIAGYKSAACTINVPKPVDPTPGPTPGPGPEPQPGEFTISLNKSNCTLGFGESIQLVATTSEDAEVTWAVSDDSNIVTVNDAGLVTAGNVLGTATVTASANGKSAYCVFNVEEQGGGGDEDEKTVRYFFFIDFNSADENDETGTKLLASFKWYPDRPVGQSNMVPADPTQAPTEDFPYFIGWSDHPFVDTKDDLIDVNTYCSGDTRTYKYIFGIWSDVQKGAFDK